MSKTYTKEELISALYGILRKGYIRSRARVGNDGAVGNTLEDLLEIKENNIQLPDTGVWELKSQRKSTSSLITLKHMNPSPRAVNSSVILPIYGWRHDEAGSKYPEDERSFRSTTSAVSYTDRGFSIIVDRNERKFKFTFNADKVDRTVHDEWFKRICETVGIGDIEPQPFWEFERLDKAISKKIKNTIYIVADDKIENDYEYFHFFKASMLAGYTFEKFVDCVETGKILFDFDARTGHDHGTKIRIKQNNWPSLYSEVTTLF